MRLSIVFSLIVLAGCAALTSCRQNDPEKVKANVFKVIEQQRAKKDWMKVESCPVDLIPEKGDRPKLVGKDCASNPSGCLARCDSNDGHSCYALAQLIQEHDTIDNDVAHVLYRRSCDAGVISGCTNAAASLFERKDDISVTCGARTFQAACEKGDPWGCTMNGLAFGDGVGQTKNVDEAKRSLDRACELAADKNGEACITAKELKARFARSEP